MNVVRAFSMVFISMIALDVNGDGHGIENQSEVSCHAALVWPACPSDMLMGATYCGNMSMKWIIVDALPVSNLALSLREAGMRVLWP
jgi:hypothetical protein